MRTGSFRKMIGLAGLGLSFLASAVTAQADALEHWTTLQVSTNWFGLRCVAYGQGRYVAFGEYSDWGVALSSEDGLNWTLRNNGGGAAGSGLSFSTDLIYTGGKFFALGGFGSSGVSTNGIDWTIVRNGLGQARGVAYGASKYVAVGGNSVFSSTDGVTWTAQSSGMPAGAALGNVVYGAGRFVAKGINNGSVDDSGHTYVSTSGTTWTQGNIPGGNYLNFCHGLFVVLYRSGTNLLSADGTTWAAVETGLTNLLLNVTYANGLFMGRAGAYLATSTDGTNWLQYAQPLPGTGLATDGTRLVTVGRIPTSGGPNYYDGFVYCSDVLASLRMAATPQPQLVLSGLVGRSYRIEAADAVTTSQPGNWQPLATVQLPATSWVWNDPATASESRRFYRAVLLP